MEQRSPEWFAARCGKLTASRLSEALATTKSGWGASRANIRAELICERLTGVPTEGYVNKEMQWGTDTEPHARAAYEFHRNCDVALVGFVDHPRIAMSGASPDGLVGDDGLIEIKCPNTATHFEALLGQPIAEKYIKQMQWQMACTGRRWCDFCSFDPRVPEEMRLFVQRVPRDDKLIATLEKDVELFLREIDTCVAALRAKYLEAA